MRCVSDATSSFSTKSDFAAAIVVDVDYGGMSFSIIAERRRREMEALLVSVLFDSK